MRACRWSVATALLLIATAILAPPVMAESERIHITFAAPKGCSDTTGFVRALKKWTKRFELVDESQTARRFVVTITRTAASALGQLEIRAPGAEPSLRTVAGKTCDEVAAALALMTALAIDPSAQSPPPPSPTDGPDDQAPGVAPPRSGESQSSAHATSGTTGRASVMPRVLPTPPRSSVPQRPPSAPAAPMPAVEVSDSSDAQPSRWSAGFQVDATERVAPTRAWGGALFVEAAGSGAPVLRGGLFFSRSNVELPSGAGAELRWYLAFLEACPTHLAAVEGRLALYPCVAASVGALRGQGQYLDENEATTKVWADLGPTLRLRVGLWQGLSLEAQGTVAFPLRRLSFDVEDGGPGAPSSTVFSTAWWGFRAGIGVAYEFR